MRSFFKQFVGAGIAFVSVPMAILIFERYEANAVGLSGEYTTPMMAVFCALLIAAVVFVAMARAEARRLRTRMDALVEQLSDCQEQARHLCVMASARLVSESRDHTELDRFCVGRSRYELVKNAEELRAVIDCCGWLTGDERINELLARLDEVEQLISKNKDEYDYLHGEYCGMRGAARCHAARKVLDLSEYPPQAKETMGARLDRSIAEAMLKGLVLQA